MLTLDTANFDHNLGIEFRDRELLVRSLTHPSFVNEHPNLQQEDNQRLEFLGDAVLSFICGEWLYNRFPQAAEGYLTRLRAALVRTERLAGFADRVQVGAALRLGKGEEDNGGRQRAGNLCAAFEALIGALYLDQGVDAARNFVLPFFEPALDEILKLELDRDAKSVLQEWCQAHLGVTPSYQTIGASGPDHAKVFTVAVYIGGDKHAEGVGPNKQAAAQAAAQRALEIILSSQSA